MIDVPLQAVPNQQLSIQLGVSRYDITLKQALGVMAATVLRDGVTLIENVRLVAATPVLPYDYMEDGNFALTTADEDLPSYEQFGITQYLVYLTADELATLRG